MVVLQLAQGLSLFLGHSDTDAGGRGGEATQLHLIVSADCHLCQSTIWTSCPVLCFEGENPVLQYTIMRSV